LVRSCDKARNVTSLTVQFPWTKCLHVTITLGLLQLHIVIQLILILPSSWPNYNLLCLKNHI
jgi:hypothetical protein